MCLQSLECPLWWLLLRGDVVGWAVVKTCGVEEMVDFWCGWWWPFLVAPSERSVVWGGCASCVYVAAGVRGGFLGMLRSYFVGTCVAAGIILVWFPVFCVFVR